MKFYNLLIALIVISFTSQAQITMEGVTLPATLQADNSQLVLNGAGVREKLWFDLYVGGLYLTTKSTDALTITNADQPMAIKMHIISKMITSERMQEAIEEGFEKSTSGNVEPYRKRIDLMVETFKEEIVIGDIFDIIYKPEKGVELYKNDQRMKTIDGLDFKKALFGIWLSEDPADKGLKKGMLGNS